VYLPQLDDDVHEVEDLLVIQLTSIPKKISD